jgi:2-isopropylmalate synthase
VDCIIMCDTNGGTLTSRLREPIKAALEAVDTPLGIHAHNAADLAVANTLAAVEMGVAQVQGCINGYGDGCGNADMISVIANLKLKLGIDCISDEQLAKLTEVSHYVSETANLPPSPRQPYVGTAAFAHKAGLHVAALIKHETSYQHIDPALVGNDRRILVSELSGQRNIQAKLKEQGVDISLSREEARHLLGVVKLMESRGYQYEGRRPRLSFWSGAASPTTRLPSSWTTSWWWSAATPALARRTSGRCCRRRWSRCGWATRSSIPPPKGTDR